MAAQRCGSSWSCRRTRVLFKRIGGWLRDQFTEGAFRWLRGFVTPGSVRSRVEGLSLMMSPTGGSTVQSAASQRTDSRAAGRTSTPYKHESIG
jgi:hypothetical protein